MIINLPHNNFHIERKLNSDQGLVYFKLGTGAFSRFSIGPMEQALLKICKTTLRQINFQYPEIWTQL